MFGTATTLVCWMILVAFSAAGGVQLLRQIPWVQQKMMEGKKPWVCNLCMSFWTTIVATGFWSLLEHANMAAAIPAFATTLLVVNILTEPQSDPDLSMFDVTALERAEAVQAAKCDCGAGEDEGTPGIQGIGHLQDCAVVQAKKP